MGAQCLSSACSQSDLSPVRAHSARFCQTLVRFHRYLNLPRASPFRTAAIAACPIVLSALYIRACHSTRMRALGREEHSCCCHCCLLLLLRSASSVGRRPYIDTRKRE